MDTALVRYKAAQGSIPMRSKYFFGGLYILYFILELSLIKSLMKL